MDDRVRNMFLREIVHQAEYSLAAYQDLLGVVRELQSPLPDIDHTWLPPRITAAFRSLHSLVTHAGNISKLLWPSAKSASGRGAHLRSLLGIPDDSPLKNRTIRNHLEHFDERLDDWAIDPAHSWVGNNIGPLAQVPFQRTEVYRWFDQSTFEYIILGDAIAVDELAGALEDLQQKATRLRNNPAP